MFRSGHQRGFSLIEINVAVFLLLIGFLGITGLVLATINNNNYNRNLYTADAFTSNMVETWKSASFREIMAFLGGEDSYTYTTEEDPDFGGAEIETHISAWKTDVTTSLKQGRGIISVTKQTLGGDLLTADIEVTVQWVQKGKVYHSKKSVYRSDI